jgi:hypothetical protein
MFHQGKMIHFADWRQRTGLRTGQEWTALGQRRNRPDLQTQTKNLILASWFAEWTPETARRCPSHSPHPTLS